MSLLQKSLLCVCAIQPNILGHVEELLSDTWTLLVAIFDCLSSRLYYCSQSWLQTHKAPLQGDHMTHCTDTSLDLVTCMTSHMREDCHFWAEVFRATAWSATFSLPPPRLGQCSVMGCPISVAHKRRDFRAWLQRNWSEHVTSARNWPPFLQTTEVLGWYITVA